MIRIDAFASRIRFTYTNYRGETDTRVAKPISIWFGSNQWHTEPQWLMCATDLAKNEIRDFAMKDMGDVQELKESWQ